MITTNTGAATQTALIRAHSIRGKMFTVINTAFLNVQCIDPEYCTGNICVFVVGERIVFIFAK